MTNEYSKLNFYHETIIEFDNAAPRLKAQQQAERYKAERPENQERQAKLDFNEGLVGTPAQINKIRTWSQNSKQQLLLIHIIGCTTIADIRAKKAINQRVPVPYQFLDEFRLRTEIKDLVQRGILEETPYENKGNLTKGRCARYRLTKEKYSEFITKGSKSLRKAKFALTVLNPKWSALTDRRHPRLSNQTSKTDGVKAHTEPRPEPLAEALPEPLAESLTESVTEAITQPLTDKLDNTKCKRPKQKKARKVVGHTGVKIQQQQQLRINIRALHDKLTKHRQTVEQMPTGAAKEHEQASYEHTARCIGLIQAQLGETDKQGTATYQPKYVQTEAHLRMYEVGGGYQGLPKAYKDTALTGTEQNNADFKMAHPTILHQISMHIYGDSPLTNILKGDYPKIGTLARKSVKKIVCAAINGCKVSKMLDKHKYAIANICRDNGGNTNEIQTNINKAIKEIQQLADRVKEIEKQWIERDTANDKGRATLSELYQTIEQQALQQTTQGNIAANEHDGWVTNNSTQAEGTTTVQTVYGDITLEWEAHHYTTHSNTTQHTIITQHNTQTYS